MCGSVCQHARVSQPRDTDDFLGWAPELGLWDVPAAPPAIEPPRLLAIPTPPPVRQAPVRRSGVVAHQPTPARIPAQAGRSTWPVSKLRVPALVGAALMLIITFFTALMMATDGPDSSPVMLGVFGLLTTLLGRVAWVHRRR